MADETTNGKKIEESPWTFDIQRGLAWSVVTCFHLFLLVLVIRVAIFGTPTDALELLKQGFNALINVVMVVVGYFFGSSKSSQGKDDTSNKIIEKLTSPPVVPGAATATVAQPTAWWTVLKPEEQTAITAANADPEVAAFILAAGAGKATVKQLDYLVAKGLLTQERADIVKATP